VPVPVQASASASTATFSVATGRTRSDPKGENKGEFGDAQADSVSMDVFGDIVPVPMIVPGAKYDGKRPWFYSER